MDGLGVGGDEGGEEEGYGWGRCKEGLMGRFGNGEREWW